MPTTDRVRVLQLIRNACALDSGPRQIGLLEEAARLADLLADIPLAFEARNQLITASHDAGAPEKAMMAFSWCLARYDQEPGRYSEQEILNQFFVVTYYLLDFPRISRAQIEGAVEDLGLRLTRAGYGRRSMEKLRMVVAEGLGDIEASHAAFVRWRKLPRDGFRTCESYEIGPELTHLVMSGSDDEAIHRGRAILEGTDRSPDVCPFALALLLLPLVRLGRLDEATSCHLRGYPLIARDRSALNSISDHIEFLALTDNLARGLTLFRTHLPWALKTFDLFERFRFSMVSRFLFERLRSSARETIKLRLPQTFPLFETSGEYEISTLIGWLETETNELAGRFDARNGNDSFARKVEAHRALEALVRPFPLRKPRQTKTARALPARQIVESGKGTDGDD